MAWIVTKYALTSAIIVLITEIAKRSDRLGALIASLPFVTILALVWMQIESQSHEKIANHAWYTFWYVVPTLPMFLLFPAVLPRLGFWWSLLSCIALTFICFLLFSLVAKRFGVILF